MVVLLLLSYLRLKKQDWKWFSNPLFFFKLKKCKRNLIIGLLLGKQMGLTLNLSPFDLKMFHWACDTHQVVTWTHCNDAAR